MRSPNGYGSIKKLSGKRRRPFAVYVTTGFEMAKAVPKIDFLKDILTEDLFQQVKEQYEDYTAKVQPKAKQIQKCIGYYETRPEAMIALADYNKNPYDLDKRNITFDQVYEILLKEKFEKMKKSAREAYTGAYGKCSELKNIRMNEMRKAHMQKIMDDNKEKSRSTLANIMKLFNAVYTFCLENDICEKNYAQFVTINSEADTKKKVPFSREEIEMLWNKLDFSLSDNPKSAAGMKNIDMILINIFTGLRPSELLNLKKEDIHLEERWIDVKGTKTKAASRIVPIHKKIIPLIEKRLKEGNSEVLFPTLRNKNYTIDLYRNTFWHPVCEALGIKHTPHECRHTFASFAAASSMNKVLLKKIIGHSSGDLTEDIYTHAFIEDLVKEIDKFEI